MAVSDVISQDGGQGNVKLHPYLITLVRWCVSCLWSTANVLLQRLLAAPLPRLPQLTAGKPPARVAKRRTAGSEHLHPEPLVECAVLHAPAQHSLDVIFVHGLYGSLGNTWRQGEWRTKYKLDPTKVPLRNHSTEPCGCTKDTQERSYDHTQEMYAYETNINETNLNEHVTFKQLNGCFKTILPNEHSLITEKFYNNTLLQVDADNYGTQAKFVTELFKNDCDTNCDVNTFKCNYDRNGFKCNFDDGASSKCDSVNCKCNLNEVCKCKLDVRKGAKGGCEAGCGCVCDDCYSHCWPRDWIKEDFPGARVISINYTSDPHLWRPLWVKGTKRLRLHERADQMMEQLLALGVGQRPIVWVGHSKGGLFIKQIYCEAYEAHLKMEKNAAQQQSMINNNSQDQSDREYNINNNVHSLGNKYNIYRSKDQSSADCNIYNGNEAVRSSKDQSSADCNIYNGNEAVRRSKDQSSADCNIYNGNEAVRSSKDQSSADCNIYNGNEAVRRSKDQSSADCNIYNGNEAVRRSKDQSSADCNIYNGNEAVRSSKDQSSADCNIYNGNEAVRSSKDQSGADCNIYNGNEAVRRSKDQSGADCNIYNGNEAVRSSKDQSSADCNIYNGNEAVRRSKDQSSADCNIYNGNEAVRRSKDQSSADCNIYNGNEAVRRSKDQSGADCNIYNGNEAVRRSKDQSGADCNIYNGNEAVRRSKDQSSADCNQLLNNLLKEHNNGSCTAHGGANLRSIDEMNEIRNNNNSGNSSFNEDDANNTDLDINYNIEHDDHAMYHCAQQGDVLDNQQERYNESSGFIDISVRKDEHYRNVGDNDVTREETEVLSSNNEEDRALLSARASLWSASSGFMFYSVPHRGSPLADIKTPLTSRSVELQEIAKDCPLVLALQARWLAAARRARPRVRSLVETGRTLMSVLWLRIVSEDSADAGVGVLHGVSVDHREICKPSSRACLLYTELTRLIQGALGKCRCH